MEYPTLELNNGVEMPALGFGVYQIDNLEVCERSVAEALRTGYRLIDTAAAYENEEAVGRAIEQSDVPREDVFVTTKLWIQDAGYESTKEAFERSLERLGLEYLDLYLIHQPFVTFTVLGGLWKISTTRTRPERSVSVTSTRTA